MVYEGSDHAPEDLGALPPDFGTPDMEAPSAAPVSDEVVPPEPGPFDAALHDDGGVPLGEVAGGEDDLPLTRVNSHAGGNVQSYLAGTEGNAVGVEVGRFLRGREPVTHFATTDGLELTTPGTTPDKEVAVVRALAGTAMRVREILGQHATEPTQE